MNSNHNIRRVALTAAIALALAGCASRALPARTPPSGLARGYALVAVAAFAPDAIRPAWRDLATVAEPAARLAVAVPQAHAGGLGRIAMRWRCWYPAPATGPYTVLVSITGTQVAVAGVRVDGQRRAAEAFHSGGADAGTTTAAGTIQLAAGWHQITVAAGGKPAAQSDAVSLSIRAPGAVSAVPLVPYWSTTTTH